MQIVIDIPESIYKGVKLHRVLEESIDIILYAIEDGTPLPKGHGRLIDEREVYKKFYCRCLARAAKEVLDGTSTIIEADKAESEEQA